MFVGRICVRVEVIFAVAVERVVSRRFNQALHYYECFQRPHYWVLKGLET